MRKILSSLLLILLTVGIVSAAIVGLILYVNITGTGTYQNTTVSRGFSIADGDVNDSITYQITGDDVYLSFPLYENQTKIYYVNALKIVPDGTTSAMTMSDVYRTNSGITDLWVMVSSTPDNIGDVMNMQVTTVPTYTSFLVSGNHPYWVGFNIKTGMKNATVEQLHFKLSKYSE